jgi:hypothetical protein
MFPEIEAQIYVIDRLLVSRKLPCESGQPGKD